MNFWSHITCYYTNPNDTFFANFLCSLPAGAAENGEAIPLGHGGPLIFTPSDSGMCCAFRTVFQCPPLSFFWPLFRASMEKILTMF